MDDSFDDFKNLPADIRDRFWSFLRIDDEGTAHVADRDGFVDFLYENAQPWRMRVVDPDTGNRDGSLPKRTSRCEELG